MDSGSTDRTVEIVKAFPVRLLQIRPEEFTYGYALNLGVAQTTSDVVVSLSAHSLPVGPEWLRSFLPPFANERVAAVYGRQYPRANATIPEKIGMHISGVLSDRPRLLDKRPLFSNANGAFRRVLWENHPFDEEVRGAEDIAWVRTMQARGYVVAYEPCAAVYHSHGESLGRLALRACNDWPIVVGNLLHLGAPTGQPKRPRQAPRPLAKPEED